jgi:hypothetical protein
MEAAPWYVHLAWIDLHSWQSYYTLVGYDLMTHLLQSHLLGQRWYH